MPQGSEELYISRVDGITAIVFVGLSTPTTSTSPSPTTPTMEDQILTAIIIIVVMTAVVLVIITTVVVCVAIKYVPLE